jgi:RNA polymerase sigma-70 factor (ECF subfamily)
MASTSPRASNDREDSDWLLGIRAGDTAAFSRFYTAYRSRLSRFVSRFVDSQETIEEIVNDSFMVVWFHAGDFRAESKVSTWIFGIAFRLSMKAVRRFRRAEHCSEFREAAEIAADPAPDVELQDWLLHTLRTLAPDQRDAVILGYLYGYSIREISKVTGAPAGTIKSRLFHGRLGLRAKAGTDTRSLLGHLESLST